VKQQYFVVVLAHSLHGRLRRVHIPHKVVYITICLALLGSVSLFGFVSSYLRMTWKIANYNSLRGEIESLRERYRMLQMDNRQTRENLANLQLFATEVSLAYGIKRKLEGPADVSTEGRLIPTLSESLEEYNLLKSASLSRYNRTFNRRWQTNTQPSLWPVNGRLMSSFGHRADPFSGEGLAFHAGVDISAPYGTSVRTTADGIISHAEWFGSYGKLVIVDHGKGLQTYYAHLSRFEVVAGQEVRRGDIIGRSGATGRVTSPHLHYEVRQGGTPTNPYRYLKSAQAHVQTASRDLPF
jgi:murein DD-endopeptidase MepM/ murein hydrolase activator NlpD